MIEKKIRQERVRAWRAKIASRELRIDSRKLAECLISVLGSDFFYDSDFRLAALDARTARPVAQTGATLRWLLNGAGKREPH
jgi:hypothetical protein